MEWYLIERCMMKKVQSVRAVDQVVHTLRQQILSGEYSIGTRLPAERALSTELGVNRLTLRAAISYLEAEGLLKAQQGQGVTVCDFHHTASLELLRYLPLDERLSEVLSLRQLLLAEAVSQACSAANAADINRLKSIADQQIRRQDDDAFVHGDHHFFSVLVESTQNFTLQLMYNSISRITATQSAWTEHLITNKQQAFGSYQAFIKLIAHRNPDLAKKTLLGHLSDTEKTEVTSVLTSRQ